MAGAGQSSQEMASSELEGFNGGRQEAQSIELDVESREASCAGRYGKGERG
jgi:hypothetical protein